ncbi:glycosyltransferase family 1 protein [Bacillus sp. AK128]
MDHKPLKILHVVGAMNRAGTETMLMNVYRNINRKKIQFDFISFSNEEAHYDQEIKRLGGRVIMLSRTQSIKEIYKAITRYGPYDAVHAHTLFHCGVTMIAAYFAGVKIRISHAHTTQDYSSTLIRKFYINSMRLIINNFSTKLLACSEEAGKYLFGELGILSGKYSYFPNIINYSQLLENPKAKVNEFKLNQGIGSSLVIGHIGRFIEPKNHSFLLDIFKNVQKKVPDAKLLLVGDGDLRSAIERKAKQDGISKNIRFVGVREDIPTLLHSMDVFVFPSKYEGLGLVLLEAQASGVPCLVSEAIQPEADIQLGLIERLTLNESTEIWAEKILELRENKERSTTKITRYFEESGYSLEKGISKLVDIYKRNGGEGYEEYIDRLL